MFRPESSRSGAIPSPDGAVQAHGSDVEDRLAEPASVVDRTARSVGPWLLAYLSNPDSYTCVVEPMEYVEIGNRRLACQ